MNDENYATLEQSKRMKELGSPQGETDCVWIKIDGTDKFELETREQAGGQAYLMNCQNCEWYAAPAVQEIPLNISEDECGNLQIAAKSKKPYSKQVDVYTIREAQSCADMWLWQEEHKE